MICIHGSDDCVSMDLRPADRFLKQFICDEYTKDVVKTRRVINIQGMTQTFSYQTIIERSCTFGYPT